MTEKPKTGFNALTQIICVDCGFCGCIKNDKPLHVTDLIPSEGEVTADQFVEWVFLADNMNPNSDPEKWQSLKDKIRRAFVETMGGEIVDVSKLQYT